MGVDTVLSNRWRRLGDSRWRRLRRAVPVANLPASFAIDMTQGQLLNRTGWQPLTQSHCDVAWPEDIPWLGLRLAVAAPTALSMCDAHSSRTLCCSAGDPYLEIRRIDISAYFFFAFLTAASSFFSLAFLSFCLLRAREKSPSFLISRGVRFVAPGVRAMGTPSCDEQPFFIIVTVPRTHDSAHAASSSVPHSGAAGATSLRLEPVCP